VIRPIFSANDAEAFKKDLRYLYFSVLQAFFAANDAKTFKKDFR